MTQDVSGISSALMDSQRNNYGAVCVYCHTPHGASTVVQAPLWNRTASSATYTTYDSLGTSTLTQPVTAPGPNSLTCLSCHDGTLGVDSVINMPNVSPHTGAPSANYLAAQMTSQNNTFLNTWQNPGGLTANHVTLGDPDETPGSAVGCMACHSDTAIGNTVGPEATNFAVFTIGTNLTNDHPVGILFPAPGPGIDFNDPTGSTTPAMATRWSAHPVTTPTGSPRAASARFTTRPSCGSAMKKAGSVSHATTLSGDLARLDRHHRGAVGNLSGHGAGGNIEPVGSYQ
jgi:hypothetical protein